MYLLFIRKLSNRVYTKINTFATILYLIKLQRYYNNYISSFITNLKEDGNLVALVQLDSEKLKKDGTLLEKLLAAGSAVGDAVHDFTEDILYKQESLISEIKFFVNEKVNKMSKITTIKFIENFEKTASQKIKRYMYNKDKKDKNDKKDKS